jgi:hypothetical protein
MPTLIAFRQPRPYSVEGFSGSLLVFWRVPHLRNPGKCGIPGGYGHLVPWGRESVL